MSDFTIRGDSVNVEQIMRHIRARIREKRGVDYTEQEIRELATARLEKFLDPENVRSELLQEFRRGRQAAPPLVNYEFEDNTLFDSHRAPVRWLRRLMLPILKLFFFNPNPLIQALHIQSELNARFVRDTGERADLTYEVMHNLVVELTRLAIEVKNLKMRVESISSRLDFDERRARALEGVVQYRPDVASAPSPAPVETASEDQPKGEETEAGSGSGARGRRRRRRRSRRSGVNRADSPASARGPETDAEAGAPGAGEPGAEADEPEPVEEAGAGVSREAGLGGSRPETRTTGGAEEPGRPPTVERAQEAGARDEGDAGRGGAARDSDAATSPTVIPSDVEGRDEPGR